LVGIAIPLPFRGTPAAIEDRRKLVPRPLRIFFPEQTSGFGRKIGETNRKLRFCPFLVGSKELSARRKIVIDHVKGFSVDPRFETCQDDRFRTIINEGQREPVGSAKVDEKPEGIDPNPAA
jgi:hypothetical protein